MIRSLSPSLFAIAMLSLTACQQAEAPLAATTPQASAAPNANPTPAEPALAAATEAATTASADDGKPVLRVNSRSGNIDCNNKHVEVLENNAQLTFKGQCLDLFFIGDNVTVTIADARLVQVVGNHAKLTIAGDINELRQLGDGGQHTLAKVDGLLYVQGNQNQVDLVTAKELHVIGRDNNVHWSAATPEINDLGSSNVLKAKQ